MYHILILKFTIMKTKVFVITAMFIGGLLFTSCQKDNALLEDDAFAKNLSTELYSEDPDPIEGDPMKNYPDPFINTTTIEYVLDKTAHVKLAVHNDETGLVQILVSGLQARGVHYVKFNAHNLPKGEYVAQLKIGDKVIREIMTKKGVQVAKDDPNIGLEQ